VNRFDKKKISSNQQIILKQRLQDEYFIANENGK
jgi:hypothetical protein